MTTPQPVSATQPTTSALSTASGRDCLAPGSTARGSAATAGPHDAIGVVGAREHNLRDVTVTIPKRQLTVFTGVSGSGKSSLVFSTIAAEARRLINATYDSFVQGFMPSLPSPDVDALTGLTPAIIVDQERLGANPRSTLGTASDVLPLLRVLFSRLATPHIGGPQAFAFNVPTVTGGGALKTSRGGKTVTTRKHFTVVGGMCSRCEGSGRVTDIDEAALLDESLSVLDGAIQAPGYNAGGYQVRALAETGLFRADVPVSELTEDERHNLLHAEPRKVRISTHTMTYEGLIAKLRGSLLAKDPATMAPANRAFVERAVVYRTCPDCEGTRLAEPARTACLGGLTIAEACALPISDLAIWVGGLLTQARGTDSGTAGSPGSLSTPTVMTDDAAASQSPTAPESVVGQAGQAGDAGASSSLTSPAPVPGIRGALSLLERLAGILAAFERMGLGYLSLDRAAGTLSGGEAQRMKLVRHLGSALTDVTYVLDEPSIGLHPHDVAAMADLLRELRDKGNTVLVVEHKPEVIAAADHVIDLGPGAGAAGGEVTFNGPVSGEGGLAGPAGAHTLTGRHLADWLTHGPCLKEASQVRQAKGAVAIRGAATHNLRDVDVDVPTGVLTVVTGVAGSGKSSLIHGSLAGREGVVVLDQSPLAGSRRSTPATYTGLLEPIRKAFAKENGVKPALFSANSEGACPVCEGAGVIDTQLGFMETVTTPCEACGGRRYNEDVLGYRLGGLSIADVLDRSAADALDFFSGKAPQTAQSSDEEAVTGFRLPAAAAILSDLVDANLGYLRLGQPVSSLSGGERQRLRLAVQLGELRKARKAATRAGARASSRTTASDGVGPEPILVLDEPTVGLHLADIDALLAMLDRLVDGGTSVVVIEHHQAVVAHADWVIDLGPGAGRDGGQVIFTGTPVDLVGTWEQTGSLTGRYLTQAIGH